ncbi:hypothetical protein NIES2100_79740 (plasmid) [Calothrix sp. NIES-2100]|uniref:hypothetical protein n=1 Tax=Calothrix sp. NIES-2100 TaxID=1954172 RepID=UPI000B5EA3FF|nr:hypothetical protein NIES2100_79740 [Calothrix sp. NIES-2100]
MTNTPQDTPNRLDRIEAILATVATQQAANTTAIAHLTQDVDYLREITLYNIELTQQDREQAERDRQAFQTEIRRIWEYLLQQSGNGRNGGNNPPA